MTTEARTITGLLDALATWLAPLAGLVYETGDEGGQRTLFIHHLPDGPGVPDVAARLSMASSAPLGWQPLDHLRIACVIRGAAAGGGGSLSSAMILGDAVHDALIDSTTGLPKRGVSLSDNWYLHEIDVMRPQSIGNDEAGRPLVSVQIDITAGLKPPVAQE